MRKPIQWPLGKGLSTLILCTLCPLGATLFAQPCPTLTNCPQSTVTYCDETTNDYFLWNYPPFTVSPTIGDSNLHEAPIDLNIKLKGCSGGGVGTIVYTLYLDLDDDGLQETVITSYNPPPAGRVQANNAFNPGYSGGDTVIFDGRYLPDSMLYRFAIEIQYSGDTTIGWVRFSSDAEPYNFSPVQLPEGRHRIEWKATQDGVSRYCDRNFKVKDCKKPSVACKSGMAVYLDATQTASLPLADALQSFSDNITPDTQMLIGMRRLGAGFGFPLDPQGNPQDTAMFSCQASENQFVEVWAKDKAGNLENCTAAVLVYDTAGFCPFVPFPSICATSPWNDEIIKGVAYKLTWYGANQMPIANQLELNSFGCTELSSTPNTNLFSLVATKDTVPRNGVTTYDLVLMSKHILALEPFDVGWKMTAADINQSNSITTFDIVELRKLIIGLTQKLPNNTPSWRFFVDTCAVWGSPFFGYCPSTYTLPFQPISAYPPHLSFIGVKMGDVNGSAANVDTLWSTAETRGAPTQLELPNISLKAGETLDLPLRAVEGGSWEGMQFSLKFDPDLLDIEQLIADNTLPLESENWAKPESGNLNLSWSAAQATDVLPGDALFHLRVKARLETRISEAIQLSNTDQLFPEVYDETGVNHPLKLTFSNKIQSETSIVAQIFEPVPNPTLQDARIPIRLNTPETVVLEMRDLRGKLIFRSSTTLEGGAHFLEVPAAAMATSGVYVWRVSAGNVVKSGRLVRL